MENEIIQPTKAFQLLIENTSSVYDCRQQGIDSGILDEDMPDNEAINWLNAYTLYSYDYDYKHSPLIYFSFLENYCSQEYSEGFAFFYLKIAKKENIDVFKIEKHPNIEVLIDIREYAIQGKDLGYKKHWGNIFKEPYLSQWNDAFLTSEYEQPVKKKDSFLKRWFGKKN